MSRRSSRYKASSAERKGRKKEQVSTKDCSAEIRQATGPGRGTQRNAEKVDLLLPGSSQVETDFIAARTRSGSKKTPVSEVRKHEAISICSSKKEESRKSLRNRSTSDEVRGDPETLTSFAQTVLRIPGTLFDVLKAIQSISSVCEKLVSNPRRRDHDDDPAVKSISGSRMLSSLRPDYKDRIASYCKLVHQTDGISQEATDKHTKLCNDIKVTSVTATFDCKCRINLEDFARYIRPSEYNPTLGLPYCKLNFPFITARALIYAQGKIIVVGAKTVKMSQAVIRQVLYCLEKIGYEPEKKAGNYLLYGLSAKADLGRGIDINRLNSENIHTHMSPGSCFLQFTPKVDIVAPDGSVVQKLLFSLAILIFSTGKVVFLGGKSVEQVTEIYVNQVIPGTRDYMIGRL